MATKPDTRTDIQRLNDSIRQRQKTGRLTEALGDVISKILDSFRSPAGLNKKRKAIEEKLAEQKLTDDEYDIANRFLKDELFTPPARNVRGRFKYTTPSSPEDKKEYKKGGVKRKPREFAHGGAYRGKAHAYAAGGRVTDTSKPKGRKK